MQILQDKQYQIIMDAIKEKYSKIILMTLGTASIITTAFPLDLLRTRLQTSPELLKRGDIKQEYRGYVDCFRKIARKQKWNAFWKGNGSNLIRFFISQTCNFMLKEMIQLKVKRQLKFNNHSFLNLFTINFLSGTIGACLTLGFIYPFELCRQRLSNDVKGTNNIRSILTEVYKAQGIRGIYKGSLNFFVTAALFRSFYFGIFDTIKNIDRKSLKLKVMGAYLASICSIYVVYPFDTIRKRIIMAATHKDAYTGLRDAFKRIYTNEGIKGFYRGSSITFLSGWVATSVLCLYDTLGQDFKQMAPQQSVYETF